MKIISPDSPISDAILADPSIIPVINRLGISLGTRDASVAEVATRHNLSADFLASIINTFAGSDFFPATALSNLDRSTIVSYLEQTDRYYLHFQIPNIERHFNALVASGHDNSALTLLRRFFDKAKADLTALIEHDLKVYFPTLRGGASPTADRYPTPTSVEEMLADLLSMIVKNISGDYDPNLCYATIVAVDGLRADLSKNTRIRRLLQ